jgi:competence protein ComEA
MLKKVSLLIGFTETEVKVIIFLFITFTAGFIIKEFFINENSTEMKQYDYSAEDSIFLKSRNGNMASINLKEDGEKFDYKQEVLDFKNRNFKENKSSLIPLEKSININKAGIPELLSLPGIGKKTAEEILKLRNKRGKFLKIEELLEIRGIGETKFHNIKNYIYIE